MLKFRLAEMAELGDAVDLKSNIKPRVKTILFDLDGVLVDSYKYWFHLFNKTLKHFGHKPVSLKVFGRHWGQSTEKDIRIFMSERTLPEVKRYFTRHISDFAVHIKGNTQAREILRQLKKNGYSLGCVTNSHRRITILELKTTGLKKYFKIVLTADDVRKPKPDPEMLITACKELGSKPSATIFIGDTKTDLQAGRKAGCIVIGYRTGKGLRIDSLGQLCSLIRRLNG